MRDFRSWCFAATAASVLTLAAVASSVAAEGSGVQIFDFERDPVGGAPSGFSAALTGQGRAGNWVITEVPEAPSGRHVLAQTDADRTSYRFPLMVSNNPSVADVELSVRFRAVSGEKDAAAGLVWRLRDADNYYVVRANALESNVVLYKVEHGKRTDLPPEGQDRAYGVNVKVSARQWHTLQIRAVGPAFAVSFDGVKLFEVRDETFTAPGKVGVWTKADSVTWFDDLTIRPIGAP